MAAPLDINREEVRMLVLSVGCREAARKMGLNENTVLQWASRGGWLDAVRPQNAPQLPASMQATTVIGVIKPADALADTLKDLSGRSRMALAVASAKGLEHIAQSDEQEIVMQADQLLKLGKAAGMAGDWLSASNGPAVSIALMG